MFAKEKVKLFKIVHNQLQQFKKIFNFNQYNYYKNNEDNERNYAEIR